MKRLLPLAAVLSVCLSWCAASEVARAGDEWLNMTRFTQRVHYSDPCRRCFDCQMGWQPYRSVMHPNMLPPGMLRPPPIIRSIPSLLPRMPWQWKDTSDWTGCNGQCYDDGRRWFKDEWNHPGH